MRKTKQQHYFKPNVLKKEDLTPKILAKSPLNYRQQKLPGQSSAIPANRTKQKDSNIFKLQKPTSPYESPAKERHVPTEQQLEDEIMALIKRQQLEFQKLDEAKETKENQIKQVKKQQHEIKLEIWELRNENMELKDAIETEQEEYEKLMEELGITQEQFQNQLREAEIEQHNEGNSNQNKQTTQFKIQ